MLYKLDYDSPIGIIEITGTEKYITSILFPERELVEHKQVEQMPEIINTCYRELDEYFNGKRKDFTVAYHFEGTEFQNSVWQALTTVPFGKTASYKEIAQQIGNEKAVRAVGMTNSKNLISIIVPCHRVIGASGKLTGYAGGIWRKEWLLEHEKKDF
ncbi:methylated-DNA--[protein]-cysteine S-methyltransferase [Solibacillus sp. MA9]|uniref:Methylated-DNA--protein-cysteine methyltransferase n=1 Tax=Solibacillus palustris TaxID=2908203 RepID=A0ABS9UGN6_9BACL|nr:methylated-DNA--[protein]-cysteine S-methyltransferase [Solibacillus sp. MA9]MCH7323525.1 methylated-DNA--[protein]-cysteine S-methyltransferase [Solibacillus sp. MA9]